MAGSTVPIPCRHCGKKLIPFVVQEGKHAVQCPRCGAATEVRVTREGDQIRIRTSRSG